MTVPEIKRLIEDVTCGDFEFLILPDDNFCFLQARYMESCVVTGQMDWQMTRKWRLSPWMTKSEIVHSVFKCCLASVEHRHDRRTRRKVHALSDCLLASRENKWKASVRFTIKNLCRWKAEGCAKVDFSVCLQCRRTTKLSNLAASSAGNSFPAIANPTASEMGN